MTPVPGPTVKRILCLANSRKLQGRCIAGKEVAPGGPGPWVRPVSARPAEEVGEYERQYEDGSDPRVLDILDVPLLRPHPKSFQPENWLLDPGAYWRRIGRMDPALLGAWADDPPALWIDGHSTNQGRNDRVPLPMAEGAGRSLHFLRVSDFRLSVVSPGAAFGNPKRRVRGWFSHRRVPYGLWVTDPLVERAFLARPDGEYGVGEAFLTVSLGEPFEGHCYKLVAAVVLPG